MMPPLKREGGPEDEPQARRPAGSLTVCLPRGGWPQARFPEARSHSRGVGFSFSLPDKSSARWQPLNSEGFMRFSDFDLSTIFAIALLAPIAHADQPASAASPAQTQTQKASPPKKATQTSTPAKKEEAQKLESGGRHRDSNPATNRRDRHHHHRRRGSANPGAEDRSRRRRAARGPRRAGHAKRLARLQSPTSRFAARPRRRPWSSSTGSKSTPARPAASTLPT